MTSKLKCPLCQKELVREGMNHWWCLCNLNHQGKELYGTTALWQALTQAKQDLKITTKVLEKLNCEYNRCRDEEFEGADIDWEWWAMAAKNVVETALEQITHDNSEKANNGEHKE